MSLQPIFQNLPERKVIGLGAKFISVQSPEKNNHIVIPKLWDDFVHRQDEIKNRNTDYGIGLITGIPPGETKSHPYELFYIACAEVPDTNDIPTGMIAKTVPAGNYAIFNHRGKISDFGETLNYIYRTWLPNSGKKSRKAPELEIYDHRFNPNSDTSEMDIYIPVE